ncbi:DNA polymerase I [Bifidobacterium callimiconis]|uniref:DNA polymerase I n=1 Tax=Bifidobacterium callimiconis TaxID=2306973 RepID=A0A430FIB8_9BIFI|nr:DNA polymerase I [Bifidobacterium callimiconis]MBT1176326.1 DNA polymerase I [Bifidobacterium callimiconis]RSX52550.1 DNA polymerase I [Bifidobacterium callimiconis]
MVLSSHDSLTTERATAEHRLLVVDGHSLAFRAYFALPAENFTTSAGFATNAVWGFANMLTRVILDEHPTHVAVAFDVKGGTFRNDLLPQYKGTRDAAPEDLLPQLPVIQDMLKALGVTYIEKPGYEGDDVIATLATMGEKAGFDALVLSGDRDAFQLIDDRITVLYPGHHFKDLKHMTPEAVEEKYKVSPQKYPDLAALRGETADNIPGVPGVGDGFAAKWINQFGGLDGIIEHADEIKGKKGDALRENIEQVKLNRKVNALVRDLDLGVDMNDLVMSPPNLTAIDKLFASLEFGPRTKTRLLKAFPGGVVEDGSDTEIADDEPTLEEPILDSLDGDDATAEAINESLLQWIDTHIAATITSKTVPDSELTDATLALEASWILHAEGNVHPGATTLDAIALLGPDNHAVMLSAAEASACHTALQQLLDARAGACVLHGLKEQSHLFATIGVHVPRPWFDTQLAGYLVESDYHPDSLDAAAAHFLDLPIEEDDEPAQGELALDIDDESDAIKPKSVIRHIAAVRALAHDLAPKVVARQQYSLLHTIELPVSEVLFGMESIGAAVDEGRLIAMRDRFATEARDAQEQAWDAAGKRINLQSPKQLQAVLFDDMQLRGTRKTKSGGYTTDAAALQEMAVRNVNNERASSFLVALLRHRETNKLKQIVQSLLDEVNHDDGRIHTTFEQTVAATGRLSSAAPNLQNIPNRNAAGREIRGAFVPGEGFVSLMSCDYSQVELRIMAHLSGDEALIEAFRSGADFHRYVASLVYQIPVDKITGDQRSHVKAMSYGLAYGLSTYGLAQQLKISPAEADVLKDKYFATFGKVHDYLESLVSEAKRNGYTETMFGRRRYFPGLKSTNRRVRDAAERAALNAPIQGTAADIMKIAMIRAADALHDHGLSSRIILQIHDELVVEIAPNEADTATELIRDAMENAVHLEVPLDVSTGIGDDWQLAAH